MRVVVLGPDEGPARGANLHASIWTDEKPFKANRDYAVDASGAAQVELPATYTIVRLWASRESFVTLFANWEQAELASGRGVPSEYTFRLERPTTAGGRVVDEQGRPIARARIQVELASDPDLKPARGDGRVRYDSHLARGDDAIVTDADGRWRIGNVPDRPEAALTLMVSHPDYASDKNWGEAQRSAGVTPEQIRRGTATLTLKGRVTVAGQLTDLAGRPVREALVIVGDDPYFASRKSDFPSAADGSYRLPTLPPGATTLTVIAPGFAPQSRRVDLKADLSPQDFCLEPGRPIRLRVVDPAGKPIAGAVVEVAGWLGRKSIHNYDHPNVLPTKIPRLTDANGAWEWTWAPPSPVQFQVHHRGYAVTPTELAGGSTPQTVTLRAEHRVTGRVVDAATGDLIRSFTVIPVDVFRPDFLLAERNNARPGRDGRLDFLAERTDIPLRLRVEAPGYRTLTGPEFRVGDDAGRAQDFRLQAAPAVGGLVVDGDGRPVAGAEVILATPTQVAELASNPMMLTRSTTDGSGCFAFPDPGEPWAVVARHDAGTATVEPGAHATDAGTLRLRPWATVSGQFRDGGRAVAGALILLQPIRVDDLAQPRIDASMQTTTDAEGRFEFARVVPGPARVRVYLGPWKDAGYRSGPSVPLDLPAGQRAEVDLGGTGATLVGKVDLTGPVPGGLDCTYSINHLVRRESGIAAPAVAGLGFDAQAGWRDAWAKSAEGDAYLATLRHRFVNAARLRRLAEAGGAAEPGGGSRRPPPVDGGGLPPAPDGRGVAVDVRPRRGRGPRQQRGGAGVAAWGDRAEDQRRGRQRGWGPVRRSAPERGGDVPPAGPRCAGLLDRVLPRPLPGPARPVAAELRGVTDPPSATTPVNSYRSGNEERPFEIRALVQHPSSTRPLRPRSWPRLAQDLGSTTRPSEKEQVAGRAVHDQEDARVIGPSLHQGAGRPACDKQYRLVGRPPGPFGVDVGAAPG